ncbi:RagB/SusD family nutrient uptake outer membrane protein [Sphingobacterium sp. N143]|uniref:RagB/SusD family nutrient uptake outer membrane protein n=1 Tax=Sphingobacterium sp. N143 TaxID=2746727 RepID=UPI0025762B05|nr:RagB/SusD family nutrient uptake outer membrane protein [Sphingobacterium sp. N143]MDM1296819.1 RagB/SusD family nutrient uptake outer membrane protein [Sphingobacterium sp. N143]
MNAQNIVRIIYILFTLSLFSCNKFLEEKPDISLAVPETVADVRALLDNDDILNIAAPPLLEMGVDDYYLDDNTLNNLNDTYKGIYLWKKSYPAFELSGDWQFSYRAIMIANIAMETLERLKEEQSPAGKQLKGEALFLRAFNNYNLAQIYTPLGNEAMDKPLGIPLRYSSDYTEPIFRTTLGETYKAIWDDLKESFLLLPELADRPSRPSKVAALALMARVSLAMDDYENAEVYANQALDIYSTLLDLNEIDVTKDFPFPFLHKEIIYMSFGDRGDLIVNDNIYIDKYLYDLYNPADLRKQAYFYKKDNEGIGFKGNYVGAQFSTFFGGLATDELYLISAECAARNGNLPAAAGRLNTLLESRWSTGHFVPLTFSDRKSALDRILKERRKELIFRGVRWSDIKRYNRDEALRRTLVRVNAEGNTLAELPPLDHRFYWLIPEDVIRISKIQQNQR